VDAIWKVHDSFVTRGASRKVSEMCRELLREMSEMCRKQREKCREGVGMPLPAPQMWIVLYRPEIATRFWVA
jgi:hypothetical protein